MVLRVASECETEMRLIAAYSLIGEAFSVCSGKILIFFHGSLLLSKYFALIKIQIKILICIMIPYYVLIFKKIKARQLQSFYL